MRRNVLYLCIIILLTTIVCAFTYDDSSIQNKQNHVSIIAHRGASAYAPEHTIAAYELAKEMGSDYIEIDLQLTKDGHLVAMHDVTVNRTTNGFGFVKNLTLKDIKKLNAGSTFNKRYPDLAKPLYNKQKVPTIDEIFQHFGNDVHYYIETKSPQYGVGIEQKLFNKFKQYNIDTERVIVQSFSKKSLKTLHKLDSKLKLVQLIKYARHAKISAQQIQELKTYASGVGPNASSLNPTYIQHIRKHQLDVHPYTVNSKKEMKRLIDWGVTGMFTNTPDLLYRMLHN
ncbi:glycerophosphodiester phosphodiesterase [Metabacillus iocasae]|uniref:Glycerophosphoryl diester phosphodiesterase n=1 Tax=Priestia iocasae TaxID=2291674 RepID=A0ABS2QWL2_9BACI|nr:glycerophosphodiester phosphodiesterase [Metabacillus iocasae]MBM7703141.1 glycerophosphoryl diester phosphodiesterase [Metabacillus iocasae]